jgi:hypothetical protein
MIFNTISVFIFIQHFCCYTEEYCTRCEADESSTAPARDVMILLQHLKSYKWAAPPSAQPASRQRSASRSPERVAVIQHLHDPAKHSLAPQHSSALPTYKYVLQLSCDSAQIAWLLYMHSCLCNTELSCCQSALCRRWCITVHGN